MLTWEGFDVESEKRRLATYIKERVMPMWFPDHRDELRDMLEIDALDRNEKQD